MYYGKIPELSIKVSHNNGGMKINNATVENILKLSKGFIFLFIAKYFAFESPFIVL